MQVFISFSGADRDVKNELVAVLREELPSDTSIWESDENCCSDYSTECISAIHESQVFIVLLSAASMDPTSYVINEVIEAKQMEGNGTLNIVIFSVDGSPLTGKFPFNLNHISDSNRLARMSGKGNAYVDTARKVNHLLKLRCEGRPEKPNDVNEPTFDAIKPASAGFFVEGSRNAEFLRLDAAFKLSNVIFVSEFNGYGRMTAVRKYLEIHESEYKNVYLFPLFSGSIRSFLLEGMHITNLNEQAFLGLNEREIMLRKCQLIEKLDVDTLLLVPNVTSDRLDDRFVFDLLAGVKCRIIFITQFVSKEIAQLFPVVSVGRMEDNCLAELFFRYYECSEQEQEALSEPLISYFESVDGHTKTVELTATAISEEWGIMPEEVSDILRKVSKHEKKGLAAQITAAISDLFDFRGFSSAEKQILFCAAAVATAPENEREFVELLKEAGCFDASLLRRLTEQRWINADRAARLISIDSFLADICFEKIEPEPRVLKTCCSHIEEEYLGASFEINLMMVCQSSKKMERLFRRFGMEHTAETLSLYQGLLCGDKQQGKLMQQSLSTAAEEHPSEESGGPVLELKSCVLDSISDIVSVAVSEQENRENDSELSIKYLQLAEEAFKTDAFALEEDQIPDPKLHRAIQNLMQHMVEQPQNAIYYLVSFIESLPSETFNSDEDDDSFDLYGLVLSYICQNIIDFTDDPYLCLTLCRLRYKLAKLIGGFSSVFDIYRVVVEEVWCYAQLNDTGEHAEDSFSYLLDHLREVIEMIPEPAMVTDRFSSVVTQYVEMLLRCGLCSEAEQALDRILALEIKDQHIAAMMIGTTRAVTFQLIGDGRNTHALSYMNQLFQRKTERYFSVEERDTTTLDNLAFLRDMAACLISPPEQRFGNAESYCNYYSAYAAPADRKRIAKYEAIAQKAEMIDYSKLDNAALIAKKQSLCQRAKSGEPQEHLAPEAFALVSEAGFRTLGYRHHRVQFIGAAAMLDGCIAEIQNGEGKTYTIPLTAFVHVLYGRKVHVADFSDYLCRRNFGWMRGIFELLGCSVGLLDDINPSSDFLPVSSLDVIYSTVFKEIFFYLYYEIGAYDDLSDPPRYDVLILDEADSVIDYGKTPVTTNIIQRGESSRLQLLQVVKQFVDTIEVPDTELFRIDEDEITLTEELYRRFYTFASEDFTTLPTWERSVLRRTLTIGMYAKFNMLEGKDYFVRKNDGMTRILKENTVTGNLEPINEDLGYFLLLNHGVPEKKAAEAVKNTRTTNMMTPYSFIRLFSRFCGTTATAASVAAEFKAYFDTVVCRIPTHLSVIRQEHTPKMYMTGSARDRALLQLIREKMEKKQPVLAVCENVEESKRLYALLLSAGIRAALLNAENSEDRPELLADAGRLGKVTVTTSLVNRGVDICLGGNPREFAKREMIENGTDLNKLEAAIYNASDDNPEYVFLRNQHRQLSAMWTLRQEGERKKVEALGGLCVIGTTCFNDLRLEQQLIGRCGRQGCPGESHILFSADDKSLNKIFETSISNVFKNMMGEEYLPAAPDSFLGKALRRAREKIQHFATRDINQTVDALCLAPVRATFLAPVRMAIQEKADLLRFTEILLASTPIFEKSVKAIRRRNDAGVCSQYVKELIRLPEASEIVEENALQYLSRVSAAVFKNKLNIEMSDVEAYHFFDFYTEGWTKYIKAANKEFDLHRNDKGLEHMMKKYIKTQGVACQQESADNCLRKTIGTILRK